MAKEKQVQGANPFTAMFPKEVAEMLFQMNSKKTTKTEVANTEYSKEAKKIIIPATMNKLQASEELQRQWEEEEQIVNVTREIEGWEYKDILVAIKKSTEEHFGWVNGKTTYSFFGANRPRFIQIVTNIVEGNEITEECFLGKTEVAAWENATMTIDIRSASHVMVNFECKKKYKASAMEYFDLINSTLKTNSIYRGKSVVITESQYGGVEYEIFENRPSDKIFFNEGQQMVIDDFVMPDLLDKGKRCYLFTGDYGTGKTEEAMRIGHLANKEGMSFIYLKDSQLLEEVILLCKNYDPCVLFLEDIDEVASGERGSDINHILNTLDGVQSKRNNTKIIFTTNHEEKINAAFRRPGRIDLIVKFEYPDKETKKKIATSWLQDIPGFDRINLDRAIEHFPDAQGAVIAEISKRIRRLSVKNGNKVEERYFQSSAVSIQPQLDLMQTQAKVEKVSIDSQLKGMLEGVVGDMKKEILQYL